MRRVGLVAFLVIALFPVLGAAPIEASAQGACGSATSLALNRWHHGALATSGTARTYGFSTTHPRYAIVTLGGLTADDTLTLYDSDCRRLGTSAHRGLRFEQVTRPLAPGRYFVRVTGAPGSFDLRFRTFTSGTHVVSSHAYRDSEGRMGVAGEVLNARARSWFMRWATITFYDRSGRVIARSEDGVFRQEVAPAYGRLPFHADDVAVPKSFDHYRVTVSSEPNSSIRAVRLAPRPGVPWTAADGERHYPGEFHNTTKREVFVPSAVATLYDAHGRVRYVAEAIAVPSELAPGAVGAYDVVVDSPTDVQTVRTWVVAG